MGQSFFCHSSTITASTWCGADVHARTHSVCGAPWEEVPDDGPGVPAAADAEAESVAVVMQDHHLHLGPLAL